MDLDVYIQKSLSVEILSLYSHHVPSNIDLVMDMKVRSRSLPRTVSLCKHSENTCAVCRYSRLEFCRQTVAST